MKLGYYLKQHGQTIEDTIVFREINYSGDTFEYWARQAAYDIWKKKDGWEWMSHGCIVSLVADEKDVGDFEIEVDVEPVFYAKKVKEC